MTDGHPSRPGSGRITVFSAVDAVGHIELESGQTLRFGARACRGFVPAVGLRVEVTATGPHPLGGIRATAVELAAGERAQANALLEARHPAPIEDAAAVAQAFGVLTLLLRDRVASDRATVRALFDDVGIAELGAQLDEGGMRTIIRGPTQLTFVIGSAPYPRDRLDVSHAPECPLGEGFVVFTGVVPSATAALLGDAPTPDLWRPEGSLQLITQISRRFFERGLATGVVLHRAGEVVRAPAEWLRTTASCDEPGHRAFLPWLDLGSDDHSLRSYGMEAMWLPDLEVTLDRPGVDANESYQRGHEAIQYACHQLVHRAVWLRPGDRLFVPVAVQVGSGPLAELNDELERTPLLEYVVARSESRLALVPQGTWPLASYWAQADHDGTVLAFPIYRELMLGALAPSGRYLASMSFPGNDQVPLHEVLVFQRADGQYLIITCGLARVPQPGGEDADDDRRIEFLFLLPTHAPPLAELLSLLGSVIHGRPPGSAPIGPEHRVGMPFERGRLRIGSFMIGWGSQLDFGQGPKISLFAPVAMTPPETESIVGDARVKWLHAAGSTPEVRERWLRLLEH